MCGLQCNINIFYNCLERLLLFFQVHFMIRVRIFVCLLVYYHFCDEIEMIFNANQEQNILLQRRTHVQRRHARTVECVPKRLLLSLRARVPKDGMEQIVVKVTK
jgi:hypothetical protein